MAQEYTNTVRTCQQLLLEFNNLNFKDDSSKIHFSGVDSGKDVYNITAPFVSGGKRYIGGRVESRDSEQSQVFFFEQSGDAWAADARIKPLNLQDPFIAHINGVLVVGGVEIFDDEENPGQLNYRTIFYKGSDLSQLERFAKGPDRMKDIRLGQLSDGRILVMTRPQGTIGGRGKVGYIIIKSLEELDTEHINRATILENQFVPEEWGGCNELHMLANGKIGILSHIAKYDEDGNRHYYASCFCFNPETGDYSPMKLIAVRANFADGPSKRPDLADVIFSGGLVRLENGKAQLYCGAGDAEGHTITIDDPFKEWER